MKKEIMGRTIIWSAEDRTIKICRNDEDLERYEKALAEDDLSVFTDDNEIAVTYFDNYEFNEIHRTVFPARNSGYEDGFSWQQENWTDEEKRKYIEIRVMATQEDDNG